MPDRSRCGDCPFYQIERGRRFCAVGEAGEYVRRITDEEMLDGEHDEPPDWCPRRKGAVVVLSLADQRAVNDGDPRPDR